MPDLGSLLRELDRAHPAELVGLLERFLQAEIGAVRATLLLADYDLQRLRPLSSGSDPADMESLELEGCNAGRAFTTGAPAVEATADGYAVAVPVLQRDDRIGALEVVVGRMPEQDLLQLLDKVGLLLGYLIPAAAHFTDAIERARREWPLTLPAEMQWGLLPVRAYTGSAFSLAGQLAPAYEVGGDLFDYALESDQLCISVTDAMGHGLQASMLASLAVNAMRNSRRLGQSMSEQMRTADSVVFGQFGGDQFVTGVGLDVEPATGGATIVCAGHPPPYLVRDGEVSTVAVTSQLPMGMFEQTVYAGAPMQLRPGDRLVLISDGVLEARPRTAAGYGEEFGEPRLHAALAECKGKSAHESVRDLVREVESYQQGDLRDDATMLILDWHQTARTGR